VEGEIIDKEAKPEEVNPLYFVDPEEALKKVKRNKKDQKWRFNVNEENGERADDLNKEKTCGVSCDCMGEDYKPKNKNDDDKKVSTDECTEASEADKDDEELVELEEEVETTAETKSVHSLMKPTMLLGMGLGSLLVGVFATYYNL